MFARSAGWPTAVFSGLSAYRDAGSLTVYAGCSNDVVGELIDVVVEELRGMKQIGTAGTRAAARQGSPEGQPDAQPGEHRQPDVQPGAPGDLLRPAVSLDETLDGIERVTTGDVQRVANRLLTDGSLTATVLGSFNGLEVSRERLGLG